MRLRLRVPFTVYRAIAYSPLCRCELCWCVDQLLMRAMSMYYWLTQCNT